jgi:hypothetical protein
MWAVVRLGSLDAVYKVGSSSMRRDRELSGVEDSPKVMGRVEEKFPQAKGRISASVLRQSLWDVTKSGKKLR